MFLRDNKAELIDKVKNVVGIVDYLELSGENAAIVRAQETDQARMRKLLEFTTSKSAAKHLVEVLWQQVGDVLEDLIDSSNAEDDDEDDVEDDDDEDDAEVDADVDAGDAAEDGLKDNVEQ